MEKYNEVSLEYAAKHEGTCGWQILKMENHKCTHILASKDRV